MDKKNIITKIKEMFVESTEVFMDVKLMDGSAGHIVTQVEGELNVGDTFYLLDENGEKKDTQAGDYELEDGIILSVDEAGFINEIKESDAPEEDAADASADADAPVEEMTQEMSEEKFMDITLKDGPIVHVITANEGSVDAGDKMMIESVEAAPGEYFTNDGRTITVGENGVIGSVAIVENTEDEKIDEESVATTEEVVAETEESKEEVLTEESVIEGLISQVKSLTEKVGELETTFTSMKEENESLKTEVEKFSGMPSAEPTKVKVDFKKMEKDDRLRFFANK